MVSIKDIAEKCGVSIATVSKALNNRNDISIATRKFVCSTAEAMGYLPNAQARALKTNKTFSIGVLLEDKSKSGLTHPYFSSVLDSFKVEAGRHGYDIMFINSKVGNNDMSYLEHCRYRGFDGLLVACADFCDDDVTELFKSDIPLVAIDYISENKLSVRSDNIQGIRDIVNYAYNMGHRRIAYVYGESSQVTTDRFNSFIDIMNEKGLCVSPDYVRQGKYHDYETSEKIVSELLSLYEIPECILMPDDFSAMGAFNAVRRKNLKIPDDISVIGYDGSFSAVINPCITTVFQDSANIGRIAAELLIKEIRKEKIEKRSVTVKGHLITRGTVRNLTGNV